MNIISEDSHTQTRQGAKRLQHVHAPARPLHPVGRQQRQGHHAAKGRQEREHHQEDCRVSQERFGGSGRLTAQVGPLESDDADGQEPADAECVVGSRALEEGFEVGEAEGLPDELGEGRVGAVGQGVDDGDEEEEVGLGVCEVLGSDFTVLLTTHP